MTTRFHAFSNGSEYGNWRDENCALCVHDAALAADAKPPTCPLALALGLAYFDDGTIPVALGVEYGAVQSKDFPECYWMPRQCGRFELEPGS